MAHDEIERTTVPLPDAGTPSADVPPDHGQLGHLLGDAVPSRRSKGLIAAVAAGVLVVGGAVAATVGGGSVRSADKSAAPTAGLPGKQDSANGSSVQSAGTDSSPWAWQTGQSAPKPAGSAGTATTPGAPGSSGTGAPPGAPTPTGGPGPSSSAAPGQPPSTSMPPAHPSTTGAAAPPPASAPPATVTLVVGPGCPGLPGGGGYYTLGEGADSGWGTNSSGGWSGDGCNGSMQSMPMTGTSANGPNRALWYFGSGTAGFASCVVSVYVPWDGKATDTGGTGAEYQIAEGSADTYVTSFWVNQNTTHGQWVALGTVDVGGNTVKIRLVDHGVDYPAGWRYGVAAGKLRCTA